MFTKMRREHKAISQEECMALLRNEKRGVLALQGNQEYPYAIPINFYFDEEEQTIFFHGSKVGEKAERLKQSNKVCFTVYGNEIRKENQWAPYFQSVVVFGTCNLVEDPGITKEKVGILAQKYYPTKEEAMKETKKALFHVQLYAISVEHMTGKWIQEK